MLNSLDLEGYYGQTFGDAGTDREKGELVDKPGADEGSPLSKPQRSEGIPSYYGLDPRDQ